MTTHFAHAVIKGVDSQPRKVSVVASLARDRYTADAVVILENTPRRAARAVRKAIESAVANLLNNSGVSIDPKTIRIARISVTAGTRMRRYMPASRGRALPFEKISSNIFVEVAGEEKVKKTTDTPKADAKKVEDKASAKPAESRRSRVKNSNTDSSEATPENLATKSADEKKEEK